MVSYIALYRGASFANAQMVAVTSTPSVVSAFADKLLGAIPAGDDPVLSAVASGKQRALEMVRDENKKPGGPS